MDEPQRRDEEGDDRQPSLFPEGFFRIYSSANTAPQEAKATQGQQPPIQDIVTSKVPEGNGFYKRWWGDVTIDRRIELLLAIGMLAVAGAQLYQTISNNASNTQQTDQLIAAAKYSAYAADRNANAASSFADSAVKINQGVGSAIWKLQDQANQMSQTAEAANRSANIAKEAVEFARSQMQLDQRAWVGVSYQIEAGEFTPAREFNPSGIKLEITNSGRTPAVNFKVVYSVSTSAPAGETIDDYEAWRDSQEQERRMARDKMDQDMLNRHPEDREMLMKVIEDDNRRADGIRAAQDSEDNKRLAKIGNTIAPGIPQILSFPAAVTYSKQSGNIYWFVKFIYDDIFPNSKLHTTKICLVRTQFDNFHLCPTGNAMD